MTYTKVKEELDDGFKTRNVTKDKLKYEEGIRKEKLFSLKDDRAAEPQKERKDVEALIMELLKHTDKEKELIEVRDKKRDAGNRLMV